jgi:nucleoside-diphosphate-sugar epimerase
LGLEKAEPGTRLHAVAEQAVSTRAIAQALGDALGLPTVSIDPDDAQKHFGVVGHFLAQTLTASSELTRARLGWTPTGPGLLEDIAAGAYSG